MVVLSLSLFISTLLPHTRQTARNPIDSSTTIRIRQTSDIVLGSHEDVEWKDVFHFPYGEEGGLLDFFPDNGKTAYLTSSLGRETTALLKVDTETGETLEELYSNDKCNVGGVTLDKVTKELRALTYNYARTVRSLHACSTTLVLFRNSIERIGMRWYLISFVNYPHTGTNILR